MWKVVEITMLIRPAGKFTVKNCLKDHCDLSKSQNLRLQFLEFAGSYMRDSQNIPSLLLYISVKNKGVKLFSIGSV